MNCPLCGKGQLKRETRPLVFSYRGITVVLDQPGDWCEACGEGALSADDLAVTATARHKAMARAEGVSAPHNEASIKLSELLASVTWADVKASLLWHYPATQKNIEDYRRVFSRLQKLDVVASYMRLVFRHGSREGREEKPFTDVTGRDETLNRDLEEFQYLSQPVDPEYANAEADYSLAFEPWEQWLGMNIDPQTLQDYPAPQIAAHCLWEMTFHGFEQSQIQAEWSEIKRRIDDLEAMIEEERNERLTPWEQVRKELEGEEPE